MNTLQGWENHSAVFSPNTKVADALKDLLGRMIAVIPVRDGKRVSYRLIPGIMLCDEGLKECELQALPFLCEPTMKTDARMANILHAECYPALLLQTTDRFYLALEPSPTSTTTRGLQVVEAVIYGTDDSKCPTCRAQVRYEDGSYKCTGCGASWP